MPKIATRPRATNLLGRKHGIEKQREMSRKQRFPLSKGRTSSGVGSMFWENLVGLSWSLGAVASHTPVGLKIRSFYFPRISMFITLSLFISPVSCSKHTPSYSTQNTENTQKTNTKGVVRRCMHIALSCIWLEVNVLGKLGRAQMEFGHTWQNWCTDPFPAVPVCRVGGASV